MSREVKLRTVAMQIIPVIAFALISAAIPGYAWIFFLLYFLVLMFIMMRTTRRGFKKVSEIKGYPLFREENTASIMAKDELLLKEMKEQFKPMTMLMFLPLLVIVIAPIYWNYIGPVVENLVSSIVESEFLVNFTKFLAFYAFIIAIMSVPRILIMRKLSLKKQLYIPRTFYIYRVGVYADGRLIEPSQESCYESNLNRKFIEIRSPKLPFAVRLYTLEISKLVNKLQEIGFHECRE